MHKGNPNPETLLTSHEWRQFDLEEFTIVDPDGWDRENLDYSYYKEKISFDEYVTRLNQSTVHLHPKGEEDVNQDQGQSSSDMANRVNPCHSCPSLSCPSKRTEDSGSSVRSTKDKAKG